MNQKRIVFLGTPEMSATFLEGLVKAGFNVVGVVTKEDKIRDRNHKLEPSPVAEMAEKLSLPVHKPHRLNKDFEILKTWKPDLLLTFAYGQLIGDEILALGTYKPLNLHGSLLPKYRGASPIQASLFNGDKETGVCLMEMVHDMDAGDVYAVKKIPLSIEDNYTSLCDRMSEAALSLAIESLPLYFDNKLPGTKQDISKVTVVHMIQKGQEKLSLAEEPLGFVNHVRALSYTPGAFLLNGDETIKILKALPYSDRIEKEPGTLFSPKKKVLVLQLEKGQVEILELQRPGKKVSKASDFLNGVRDLSSMRLAG